MMVQEKVTRLELGKEALDFQAQSTSGPVWLKELAGMWVVLFSYVKDATSICTTQCVSFAEHQDVFKALGVRLLGLSVDSLESHRNWIAKLEKDLGTKLDFPLIADVDKNVARLYGLLDEERGTTVRGVFIIDPKSKLKFAAYYPARIAPNVEEVLRVLRELKKV